MGDYYHHFLTSVAEVDGYLASSRDELILPSGTGIPMPVNSIMAPSAHQSLASAGRFRDPVLLDVSRPPKGRRKLLAGLGPGTDLVKHRRTRSGCFMCRSRRVKCDETRPVCERCKKGNRDCVYPDSPAPKGAPAKPRDASLPAQQASPKLSNDGDGDDTEPEMKLETIPDEDEAQDQSSPSRSSSQAPGAQGSQHSSGQQLARSQSSESLLHVPSPTSGSGLPNEMIVRPRRPDEPGLPSEARADWSHLPPDFQSYLEYFVANVTHHHYSMAFDGEDFFGVTLLNMAVSHKPLLHAVVGFSAYHATLQNPDGQVEDFLRYYNGGVTLLLECLKRKETNNVPTLVTILQLATMEEFLGDWVNLMGHQKAAFEVISQIFEPETVMETAVGRTCLNWYSRYDSYVAIMGGFPIELPREWFDAMAEYHRCQVAAFPQDVRWKIEDRSARLRLISLDMSMLYARGSRGQISQQDFAREHDRVTRELQEWRSRWDPALTDRRYLVTDFSYGTPPGPGDIVDPYKPGVLFRPPLFSTTLIAAEWHSIMMMHLSQSTTTPPALLFAELGKHAYAACQYFESVQCWPLSPNGSLTSLQPCIHIAALFLPRDAKHQMWVRRKFACLDMMGCIHPTSRRLKMAQVLRDPSCAHWWLPDDEGLTPILRSVRTFADERNAAAVDAQLENIREVRHLFAKLEMGMCARDGDDDDDDAAAAARDPGSALLRRADRAAHRG
ncbi:hypothetical protein CDD83_3571 [Cordyceps sp. RAO-2017]|nr:hypothetical protein CDD83_3571 [Cordyceps sp. RAO-2017]